MIPSGKQSKPENLTFARSQRLWLDRTVNTNNKMTTKVKAFRKKSKKPIWTCFGTRNL